MAQPLQFPQLQTTDLPCFFFFTILNIIAATMPISTAQIMIVQKLLIIQASI